ncbi:MAG: glycosyltransferase family 2 protein, partial [Clostridia bacterium]|nr:glycosyltransferase family 2 protein [Clostridia bacterium]
RELLFSIIVPVYNAEKYLAQCMDSLLGQDIDKDEYEIICINDGSKDNSLAILQEYAKNNSNVVVVDKENGGVSKARNLGLDMAKGEYVWFVDSDDWIARNCLGLIKETIEKYSPSILQMEFDYIKAEWRVQEKKEVALEKDAISTKVAIEKPIRYDGAWSSLIKKDILIRNQHKFVEEILYGEDILFTRGVFDLVRLEYGDLYINKIVAVEGDIFYYYRMRDESASRSAWKKDRERYTNSLFSLARINKTKADDKNYLDWYRQQYLEWYYRRMCDALMHWLPGLEINIKEKQKELKNKGILPCAAMPKELKKMMFFRPGLKGWLYGSYKYGAFRCPWLYRIYYKQRARKYKKEEKD